MIITGVRARPRWVMKLARTRCVMPKEYSLNTDRRKQNTSVVTVAIGI